MHVRTTPQMHGCAAACREAEAACRSTAERCATLEDHKDPVHLDVLLDCAAACAVTAELCSRGSSFAYQAAELCAAASKAAEASCTEFGDAECARACAQAFAAVKAMEHEDAAFPQALSHSLGHATASPLGPAASVAAMDVTAGAAAP